MDPFNLDMDYLIYAVGDSSFLEQVLIAVSMVINSSAFETMARIVALIAIIFIGFSSLNNNAKEFNIAPILTGIILFSFMYFPRVTAVIHDTVTDQVRVVDKVPLGIAAPASIISRIGYGISETMEQGFAYVGPGIAHSRFAESLSLVANVRKNLATPQLYAAITKDSMGGSGVGVDFERSMTNYVAECVTTYQMLKNVGGGTANNMNINELVKVSENKNTYGTKIYTNPNDLNGTDIMCGDAYNILDNALNNALASGQETAKQITKIAYGKPGLTSFGENIIPTEAKSTVMQAINALHGANISGQEYTKALINYALYEAGLRQHYIHYQDVNNHAMLVSAIEQRNTKWAAEQSMFLNTVRPLLAFFEAFIYAAFPFMLLLVLTGKIGINLISKYLLSVVWIQLWLPLLSIVNLFIHVSASRDISQLPDALNSMYGINNGYSIIQDWLAVGGMLAASVPLLSLFLISGSVYTMNSIAGRLSGSGHINEKVASPDVRDAKPMMATSTLMTGSPLGGVHKTGAEPFFGSANFSSSLGTTVASAESKMFEKQSQLSNSLTQAYGEAYRKGTSSQFAQQFGTALGNSTGEATQGMIRTMRNIMDSFGLNQQQQMAIGKAGMSLSTGKYGISAGFTQDELNQAGISQQVGQQMNKAIEVATAQTNQAAFTDELKHNDSISSGNLFEGSVSESTNKQVAHAASEAKRSAETYQNLKQVQNAIGTKMDLPFHQLANVVNSSPQAMGALREAFRMMPHSMREEAHGIANNLKTNLNTDSQTADTVGVLRALGNSFNSPNLSSDEKMAAAGMLGSIYQATLGQNMGMAQYTPYENQNLSRPDDVLTSHLPEAGSVKNAVNNAHGQANTKIEEGKGKIETQYKQDSKNIENKNKQQAIEAQKPLMKELENQIANLTIKTSAGEAFQQSVVKVANKLTDMHPTIAIAKSFSNINQDEHNKRLDEQALKSLSKSGLTDTQKRLLVVSSPSRDSAIDKAEARQSVIKEWDQKFPNAGVSGEQVADFVEAMGEKVPLDNVAGKSTALSALNKFYEEQQSLNNEIENSSNTTKAIDGGGRVKTNSHPTTIDGIGGMGVLQGAALSNVVGSQFPINSRYGKRTLDGVTKMHSGIDIATPSGTRIGSLADGVVSKVDYQADGYGYWVEVKHGDGLITRYAHLQKGSIEVKPGDRVSAGQKLADSGNSGSSKGHHLHFETFKAVGDNLYSVNPVKVVNFTNKITSPPRASNDVNLRKKL